MVFKDGHLSNSCNFNDKQNIYCQFCQEAKHEISQCPQVKNYEVCLKCNMQGHQSNSCPAKIHCVNTYNTNLCTFCESADHEQAECDEALIMLAQLKAGGPIRCYKCNEVGHIARACGQQSNQNNSLNQRKPPNVFVNKFCEYCKTKNHTFDNCFKFKKLLETNAKNFCAYCKNYSHATSDCPIIKSMETNVQICEKCKSMDHTAEQCIRNPEN